ncbi:obp33pep like protein [Nannochloropsis gaditana]|uniref:Obp33pep like protein n=1 Tax=Nannochloropsis gaditana TaxID=72520 RepID=W7UCB5_9STRA|nr:obp33pep like protein [Nannochloropsis gaditana]
MEGAVNDDSLSTKGGHLLTKPSSILSIKCMAQKPRLLLLLHHISKRQNVRTLLTSAAAFGAEVLVVGQPSFNETSHVPRRLAEALTQGENASICQPQPLYRRFHGTLEECRDQLREQNVQIWGVEIGEAAVNVEEIPWATSASKWEKEGRGGIALLLGNEGTGMSARQARVCDGFVYISQYGQGTASLNVAVAGSIVMHRFSEWAADSCQGGAEEERHVNDEFSASSVSSRGM